MTITNVEPIIFSSQYVNEDLAHSTINNICDAVMYTDHHHRIIYVNQSFEQMTGLFFEKIKGQSPKDLQNETLQLMFYDKVYKTAASKGIWQGEIQERKNDQAFYIQSVSIQSRQDIAGHITHYISIFSDLMENSKADKFELDYSMYNDFLTALPNRNFFEKKIRSIVDEWDESTQSVAILFFHLRNFSEINEKYGIVFGDIIMQRIASRFIQDTYSNTFVARWIGTEFACIIENVETQSEVQNKVNQIQQKVAEPLVINGVEVVLKTQFGIQIYEDTSLSVEDCLTQAYTALEVARQEQTESRFYHEDMHQKATVFLMEMELRRAIKEDQFELFFQPLISVQTGRLEGFEALVRWMHPTEGLISPVKFIPLAEQTGLIKEIGDIVLEKACTQAVKWRQNNDAPIKIHVNLSMIQFKNEHFISHIQEILDRTKVKPTDIGLELTETSITMNMEDTITKLNELKEMGLSIAIDDFGTGYSSFRYLIDFPVDRIKVDRSYVKAMNDNKQISAIVTAITHMGQELDVEVVAEGIETEEQLEQVKQLKFDIAQGYLFDKPLPQEQAEEKWLDKSSLKE